MSNVYSLLSTGNTFGDWIVSTNALIKENNDLAANSYHKATGTLYLDDATTGLQVNNQAIFAGTLSSTGSGSSAVIQNNLTVQTGQVYFQNTILGLTNSGQANINGLLIAQGPGLSLYVANNANVRGNVAIVGNTSIANNLSVTMNAAVSNNLTVTYNTTSGNTLSQLDSYVGRTSVVVGQSFTSTLQSNTSVNTAQMVVTNGTWTNTLQANTSVNTAQVVVTGRTWTDTLQANTNVNTAQIVVTGRTWTDTLQANTSVNTATVITNTLQANTSVNTATLFTNLVQANVAVNASLITVTSNVFTSNVIANTSLLVKGTTVLTGTANTLADLGVGGNLVVGNNLTVPGTLYMNNVGASANITNLTIPGTLTVTGNFVQSFPLIYNAASFTLSASSPVTGGNYGTFNVYRASSNASIRWDETNKYWATLNVASGLYNQIVTAEQLSNSSTSSNTFNVATSAAVNSANTFLQSNDATTLETSRVYANTIVAANVVTLQAQIAANVTTIQNQISSNITNTIVSLQSQIASNVSSISDINTSQNSQITIIQGVNSTQNTWIASNSVYSQAAYTLANTNATNITNIQSVDSSQNTWISSNSVFSQSAYTQANIATVIANSAFDRANNSSSSFKGTNGNAATASNGGITFTSLNGLIFTNSGNTVSVNTSQDLRTSAVPNFFNLVLSTALPVTSGGTGTTASTGSGNTVLSISPSLVTPNIGIPSFGNLTNCTNYGGTITSSQILNGLGYTPYSAANPTGYITTAALSTYATQTYVNSQGFISNTTSSVFTITNSTASSSTSTGALKVTGGVGIGGSVYVGGTVTAFSDSRIKKDVVRIENALEKVGKLKGYTYTRVDTGEKGTGVIAQEVLSVLPEAVHGSEKDFYSVAYGNMVGLLIEAINELKTEIDLLKGNK